MRALLVALLLAAGLASAQIGGPIMGASGRPYNPANVAITGGSITGLSGLSVTSGQGLFPAGSYAAPGIAFAAQPGLGVWRPTADIVSLSVSTGGVVDVRSLNGIGTVVGLDASRSGVYYLVGDDGSGNIGLKSFAATPITLNPATAIVNQVNADTAQTMRIYGATTGAKYLSLTHNGTNAVISASSGNVNLTGTVQVNGATITSSLSGTSASLGGGALLAGACASNTTTVTGATTSMAAVASPNTYPGDGNVWSAQVTAADTVTTRICAIIAATPTASTYNIRVIQ